MATLPIRIKEGSIIGSIETTKNGTSFSSFMGIPYAKPPTGQLRFKAPQPPDNWTGTRDARSNEGNCCLAKNLLTNELEGDCDCLYLNVFAPELQNTQTSPKPVMVWIHGGAFVCGSKDRKWFGPEFLIEKNVVIVTINYRLGALGFLSLKDPSLGVSGNAGLKDQVMALKWVQRNIHSFGGDPNNVTLFGESAGSASVFYHLLSPMSKGLFHKAIIQSGVANAGWALGSTDLAQELLKAMGKTASTEAELLEILENASQDDLLNAQLKVPDVWKINNFRYLSPTVETSTSEERFISDDPLNILKSGNFNKVPIIIGCTSNEGLLMALIGQNNIGDLIPKTNEEFVPFKLQHNGERLNEIGQKIKDFYYANETPSNENIQWFFNLISDDFFVRPMLEALEIILKTSDKNVYLYKFDVQSNLNIFKTMAKLQAYKGACHAEDMFYIFKASEAPEVLENSKESITVERMTTWWTNFAKNSDPNCEGHPLLDVTWPVLTPNMEYIHIGDTLSVHNNYESKVNNFWKEIKSQYS